MSTGLVIAALGLLVAAAAELQAATGFGFALVAGPVLYAVTEPAAAVALVLILGQVVIRTLRAGVFVCPDQVRSAGVSTS